jgi:CHAT domain-containing protein
MCLQPPKINSNRLRRTRTLRHWILLLVTIGGTLLALNVDVFWSLADRLVQRVQLYSLITQVNALSQAGKIKEAIPLAEQILKTHEAVVNTEDDLTATSLNNLAWLYEGIADYAKAAPLYQRALKITERLHGADDPETATCLSNLAELYSAMGDLPRSEPLHLRALKIRQKAPRPDPRDIATSLNNLAVLYYRMNNLDQSELLNLQALKIREQLSGPEQDADTASSLNNLAGIYGRLGQFSKAESLYLRALSMTERARGPEHPETAMSLNNLALLYDRKGDLDRAEPFYRRALSIQEKLSPEHPDTATMLDNFALAALDLGRSNQAPALVKRAVEIRRHVLANILSFTSEEQRLAYQSHQANPFGLSASVSDISSISLAALQFKGVILDSLMEDRLFAQASGIPEQSELIDRARSAKQWLLHLALQPPKDVSEKALERRKSETALARRKIEELEGRLARQVAGLGKGRRALSVRTEQVQASLPTNGTLIELLRYDHYMGRNQIQPRYGAVVLEHSGEPKWVTLGEAGPIERNIALYQKSARGETDQTTLQRVLKELYQQVWKPIEAVLPEGTRTVILSPDGQLNFVSFATLLSPADEFLAQKHSVRYVASGRDLLLEQQTNPNREIAIYGHPDYRGDGSLTNDMPLLLAKRSLREQDLEGWRFDPLPGSEDEALSLSGRARQWGLNAHLTLTDQASEARLQAVRSPYILHLATHGFFLPETATPTNGVLLGAEPIDLLHPKVKLRNPMHRSGLALAGAQRTLEAWKRGEAPLPDNDGILTAEEVGGLKLAGTWLVTLSACDTGSGQARAGEGVLGLRRGFLQAGAQNLLMTLWPVADQETVVFMLEFYEAALKAGDPGRALAEAQREWLVKLRKERGLLDAVSLAGPFILSSQGPVR